MAATHTGRRITTDMTQGAIIPLIVRFSMPLLAGNLFQQLYNTVDCVIVGNYVGKEALAAIGSTGFLINALIGFFMGLSAGGAVVISQYFGAKDYGRVGRTVHTMLAGSLIAGVSLIAFGHFASPVMLRLMATPDDVFGMADSYLRIYFAGSLFQLVYNVAAGILRALGDSRRPLYFLIASSLINVVLDFVLVLGLGMGIEGAAYATVISQAVAMVLVLLVMLRTGECYRLVPARLRIDGPCLARVLRQGLPGGIQMSITAFSNVFVMSYINRFGSSFMAGWACFGKIDQFSMLSLQSISLAVTTFAGQNYGALRLDRIKKGSAVSLGLALSFGIVTILAFEFCPRFLVSLFNRDEEVLFYGVCFLRAGAPFYVFRCLTMVFSGALRGLGNAMAPTVVMLSSFVAFRQLYLFVITRLTASYVPMLFAYPAGWGLCGILMAVAYLAFTRSRGFTGHFAGQAGGGSGKTA
ncbi:MAG: MATE family efflux transporter [Treponema sp.]|nr:MATE family efflux transporter [Treponema sp.]